jgi:hypothetical protein
VKTKATQRTLAHLRRGGYTAGIVEKWNQFANVRQDFLGFADILAVRADRHGVLAIQCHPVASLAAHRKKCLTDPKVVPALRVWLEAGNELRLEAWGLKGERGKRKLWTVTHEYVTLDQLPETVAEEAAGHGIDMDDDMTAKTHREEA